MIVPGSANPLLASTDAGGYTIAKSLRFRSSASAYLSRTPSSSGSATTMTFSTWLKFGALPTTVTTLFSSTGGGDNFYLYANNSNYTFSISTNTYYANTDAVYRDPSAWYHFVLVIDTTNATASNRYQIYVNGVRQTTTALNNYPPQNNAQPTNQSGYASSIGRRQSLADRYFDGYLSEFYFIDGQALTPSSFGETDSVTGVWKPKAYSGTYGTNGFYLKFTDVATTSGSNAGLGKDFSGNGNYWTTNNISVTAGSTYDSMTDVPTLTSATTANYCVLNPLGGSGLAIANGNLQLNYSTTQTAFGTLGVTSGKWYYEVTIGSQNTYNLIAGVANEKTNNITVVGVDANAWGMIIQGDANNGKAYNNNSLSSQYTTFTTNDVLMVAFDISTTSVWFGKNGTWLNSGNPASNTGAIFTNLTGTTFFPAISNYQNTGGSVSANFGQRPFTYTPPTGYVALNTYNLPDSTIVAGNKYFDATLYTGTGSAQTITNAGGFKPDFVWQKARAEVANHRLADSVRGVDKVLYSSSTAAEATTDGVVDSFNSNGFTGGGGDVVGSGNPAVAWQWQAGQGTTSSNTNGSITSTVSVNPTAGFSIATYTMPASGTATVGHGLGVAPSFIVVKSRTNTYNWRCYHVSVGNTGALTLNSTAATATDIAYWNNTSPTSSVFTMGTTFNGGGDFVAYCWAEIAGFSKFGSFSGNASTDNAFIYTGFRPKFVMMKRTDSADKWIIWDSARNTYNYVSNELYPNASDAEGVASSTYSLDFVSNGIKVRNAGITGTWIYACFGENPFKNSLAR